MKNLVKLAVVASAAAICLVACAKKAQAFLRVRERGLLLLWNRLPRMRIPLLLNRPASKQNAWLQNAPVWKRNALASKLLSTRS